MQTFAQKQKATEQATSTESTISDRRHFGQSREVDSMLHLQRTIGNQAVQRMVQTSVEGDTHEQEADSVADKVMQSRQIGPGGLQATPVRNDDAGEATALPIVQEVVSSPGLPLDSATHEEMRSRFGHDFSDVRIHTDAQAAESARALGARAYTVGSELVFGDGQYAPETAEGRRLLTHELTHVLQQRSSGAGRIQRQPQGAQSVSDSKHVPPGPGEFAPKEYEAWVKAHPKSEYRTGGPWEPDAIYARYTPQWFRNQDYRYAGRGGYIPWYWFEVWLSDRDGGKEFRVWRTSDAGAKTAPSPAPEKEPSSGPTIKGTEDGLSQIPPDANREDLFGAIIAIRQNVDAAFGKGDMILYADGTVELLLEETGQSYVFRPAQGRGYIVYDPDGQRLNLIWSIPEEDIPDRDADAVE